MSKNIETYALNEAMREDLMACYREVAPTCLSQQGAWRKTIMHPAKRFYVSAKHVSVLLRKYFNGRTEVIDIMKPTRKLMYTTLAKRVLELAQMPQHQGKALIRLCDIAVNEPAPRFYIEEAYMSVIFYRVRHKLYDENGRHIPQAEKTWECLKDPKRYDYYEYRRKRRERLAEKLKNNPSPVYNPTTNPDKDKEED